jgi:hypothetical protein
MIEDLRKDLKQIGYTISSRTRKLAGGPKLYLTVKTVDRNHWKDFVEVRAIIHRYYPDACMTSGGVYESTYATK